MKSCYVEKKRYVAEIINFLECPRSLFYPSRRSLYRRNRLNTKQSTLMRWKDPLEPISRKRCVNTARLSVCVRAELLTTLSMMSKIFNSMIPNDLSALLRHCCKSSNQFGTRSCFSLTARISSSSTTSTLNFLIFFFFSFICVCYEVFHWKQSQRSHFCVGETLKLWNFETLKFWYFESLKIENLETLKLWILETWILWNFASLKLWNVRSSGNFEILKHKPIWEDWNFWNFEILKLWTFEILILCNPWNIEAL